MTTIKKTIKTAFLLSAGMGKRLRPLTNSVPKPLLPVRGKAMIQYAMKHCLTLGVERFIVNTHHLAEAFQTAFPENSWRDIPIEFIYEEDRLETGTGLKNIENLLDPEETLLVYNSDILSDIDLSSLLKDHQTSGALTTLAASPYGDQPHLKVNEKNELLKVERNKKAPSSHGLNYLGMHLVNHDFFTYLHKTERESIVHAWNRAVSHKPGSVRVRPYTQGRWLDMGTIETYESVHVQGLQNKHDLSQFAKC